MEEYKVSVIIPAYNAEKSISGMLKSVVEQNYENMEIICVNDGSTDGTAKVLEEWAAKDARIKPINKENGGVGSARNAGLDAATGDFVCFFDADDTIPPRTIERHVRRLKKDGVVMCIGEINSVHMNEQHVLKATVRLGENTNIRKYTKSLNWSFSVCNKCFDRKVIEDNHLRFNDTKHGEDALFLFSYVHCCDGIIAGCPAVVYNYMKKPFWDGVSLSKSADVEAINSIRTNMDSVISIVDKSIAADKEQLAVTTELTPEEVQTKYENIDSYRSNLFRRFIHSTLLNEYYRFIWNTEEGVFPILNELYENYFSNLSDEDKATVLEQHADLRLENGLMDKKTLAGSPLVTVAVSDDVPSELVQNLLIGYYMQNFPAFEIICGAKAAGSVSDEIKSRENFHVLEGGKGGTFKESALKAAKGQYIIFNDEYMVPSTSTILEMWGEIEASDADFIIGQLMRHVGNEIVPLKIYKLLAGEMVKAGVAPEDVQKVDSMIWGNKMFRTASLRSSKTFSARSGKSDCLKKLYAEMKYILYKENAFISRLTDDDLLSKLGFLDKMSLKSKLK